MNCVATFCKENELSADMFNDQTDSAHSVSTNKVIFVFGFPLSAVISFPWQLNQGRQNKIQSTVRKKMAAVHFTTIPCEPNTANRHT